MYQIINKTNGLKCHVNYLPSINNLIAYYGKNHSDWLEIPEELKDKEVIIKDNVVIEKPLDTANVSNEIKAMSNKIIQEKYTEKFEIDIYSADGTKISTIVDISKETMSFWQNLLLMYKKKVIIDSIELNISNTSIFNNTTKLEEFVSLTDKEIDRIINLIIDKRDLLESTKVNVYNKIMNISTGEAKRIYNLSTEEKEDYAIKIIKESSLSE